MHQSIGRTQVILEAVFFETKWILFLAASTRQGARTHFHINPTKSPFTLTTKPVTKKIGIIRDLGEAGLAAGGDGSPPYKQALSKNSQLHTDSMSTTFSTNWD